MLHLIDDIRADFSFTSIGLKKPTDTFVYLDDRTHTSGDHHFEGVMEFDGLKDAMDQFGDLPTLIETVLLLEGDVWLMLDPDDMYQLVVTHYRSIYPELPIDVVHAVLRTFYIHHRFVRVKGFAYDHYSEQLPLPTWEDTERLYANSRHGNGYSNELKKHLSYEVLLAHALSVDFDNDDPFVTQFAKNIERMLWISCARDFVKRRMAAFYNGFQLKQTLDLPLNFDRNDIERQLEVPVVKRFFNPDVTYKDVEAIKADYDYVRKMIAKVDALVGYGDAYNPSLFDFLDPGRSFTGSVVKGLVELDQESLWSFMFGREKLTKDTNGVFVNYLYTLDREQLTHFTLNGA